jgi:hypothetical protein
VSEEGEGFMNEQSKFQLSLLSAIVLIIIGVLILVGIGKTIDSVTSTTIGSTLTGLIGALGGHAIGTSQNTKTGDIISGETKEKNII